MTPALRQFGRHRVRTFIPPDICHVAGRLAPTATLTHGLTNPVTQELCEFRPPELKVTEFAAGVYLEEPA